MSAAAVLCQPRIAASSSIKAVSFSYAGTTKRFPSQRCPSAIQIVRPLESKAETQPQLQPALLRLSAIISEYVMRHLTQINELQLTGQATTVMRMRFLIIFALTAAFTFGVWVTPACGQDPADVNSKTIRVRFENDRVRVLEAILPPGSKEQVHEGTFQTGDVIYRDPLTHAAENIGDKPMHFILVELKSEAASGTSARPLQREAICRNLGLPLPVQ